MRRKAALAGLNALTKPLLLDSCKVGSRSHVASLVRAATRLHEAARGRIPDVDASAALLSAALLTGDGHATLTAWHDYFGAGGADLRHEPLASEDKALSSLLPTWNGRSRRAADRQSIALAFVRSGFVDEAAFIARCEAPDSSKSTLDRTLRDIGAYAEFVRGARAASDSHYRSEALGAANWKRYRARFDTLGATLFRQLSWPNASPGDPPRYSLESLAREILSRFGGEAKLSWTDRHYGLVLAHRVVDERRVVREYGRERSVRYVVLDRVVSNGFSNWITDGASATGGWVDTDTMIAVFRTGLVRGPAGLWSTISDDTLWAQTLRSIARDSADDARRASSVTTFAPSVRTRMMRDGAIALRDSLRGRGLTGDTLARAFVSEVARGMEEVNFLHEGRHILDRGDRSLKSSDGEYRAKLSEVALSSRPWISFEFSGILQPNIGDSTAHGTANARIAREISAWIGAHAAEVRGSNRHGPSAEFGSMLNLPLLTQDQLRRAFASLDPWAAGTR